MHSFIYNLKNSDKGEKYADYDVAEMVYTADYVEEVRRNDVKVYKDAMDFLKETSQGEVNWDWGLKCSKGSLVKLSLKGMKEYCKKAEECADNEINELYGLLFINNYGYVENAYHYFRSLIDIIERRMKEGTYKEPYIYLWVKQIYDYHC